MTIVNFCFLYFFEICLCCLCAQYRFLPFCLSIIFLKSLENKKIFLTPLPLQLISFWILLSCCWSPDIQSSVFKAVSIITILVIGMTGYENDTFPFNKRKLLLTFSILTGIIIIEYLNKAIIRQHSISLGLSQDFDNHFNVSFYNRAITGLSILFWPIWSLIKSPLQKWFSLIVFTIFLVCSPSETSAFSFICGIIGYYIIQHQYVIFVLFWGIQSILFLSLPMIKFLKYLDVYQAKIPHSLLHRFKIWEYFQQNIEQKFVQGWGIDASHILSKQQFFFDNFEVSALHPHNSILQIWFELGLVGIILTSYLITFVFRSIQHIPLKQSRFLYAQIITIFVMSLSAFGLWQTWWLTLLWVAIYLSKSIILNNKSA